MSIMCYEQFIKKLFKTKSSSHQDSDQKKTTVQSDKLPRKRFNLDSDESWSSSNTGVEMIDVDSCSCRSSLSMHSSVCQNCVHSADLRSFRRHYSEYLPPKQTSTAVTNINFPPSIQRPRSNNLTIVDSRVNSHQKRRRTWNHIKCSLTNTASSVEKLASSAGDSSGSSKDGRLTHSYQFHKTFHSPPPNRNPFDLDGDIR